MYIHVHVHVNVFWRRCKYVERYASWDGNESSFALLKVHYISHSNIHV